MMNVISEKAWNKITLYCLGLSLVLNDYQNVYILNNIEVFVTKNTLKVDDLGKGRCGILFLLLVSKVFPLGISLKLFESQLLSLHFS